MSSSVAPSTASRTSSTVATVAVSRSFAATPRGKRAQRAAMRGVARVAAGADIGPR